MRKILSILLALGMVLGLSAMAAPAAALTCTVPVAAADAQFCAGGTDTYIIGGFAAPVTLTAPNDKLSVDFPTGTSLAGVAAAGVLVNAVAVPTADITVSGTHLEVKIPVALGTTFPAGFVFTLTINGVVNTATAGPATLNLDYKLVCCDAVVFACGTFTVAPAISTLNFIFDFSPSYAGIAEGFVPPFKACGQNGTGVYNASIGWLNTFNLILRANPIGCVPPCTNATMWFKLETCPAGGTVSFVFDGLPIYTLTTLDLGLVKALPNVIMPPPAPDVVWSNAIHFSLPGDYKLCFYLQCPAVPCLAGAQIVATKCLEAKVYQWKDAFKIELSPKWNLISLPLYPFDTKIASVLAPIGAVDQLMSVWNFAQCVPAGVPDTGTWYTNAPTAYTGTLANIVAGPSYWLRMKHPGDVGYNATKFPVSLWVFGNHAPVPPADPMGYFDVCDGWNMVGFKAPWTGLPLAPTTEIVGGATAGYLWNFNQVLGGVHFGAVYEWDETVQDWTYGLPPAYVLNPGVGYWIAFDGNDQIYPKP